MSRFRPRQTIEQALAQNNPGPSEWPVETVPGILDIIWKAYDRLFKNKLSHINISDADLQLERSVTELLHDEINLIMRENGGFASYLVCHERFEYETMPVDSNRPPQYDIAFVWMGHSYLKWPCEAKVIRTENAVAPYINDIETAFIPCIYAPFSSSAAMLGYLVDGKPENTFRNIEKGLNITLSHCPKNEKRPHKHSMHSRIVPRGKKYTTKLTLHHLLLNLQ